MLTANTVTGIIGALAFGFASDKLFKARRPPCNLIFGILEIAGLLLIFFGPTDRPVLMMAAFLLYGFGLTGLVTSLGGLFAVDIATKRAAGAAMGFIGVVSYLAAATQERISGYLIEQGTTLVDGVRRRGVSVLAGRVGAGPCARPPCRRPCTPRSRRGGSLRPPSVPPSLRTPSQRWAT